MFIVYFISTVWPYRDLIIALINRIVKPIRIFSAFYHKTFGGGSIFLFIHHKLFKVYNI